MSEAGGPDEEPAVELSFLDENVNRENANPGLSHPDDESFTEGNVQASESSTPHNLSAQPTGIHEFLIPIPSFAPSNVASFPPVDRAYEFQTPTPLSATSSVASLPPVDRAHEFQIPFHSFAPNNVAFLQPVDRAHAFQIPIPSFVSSNVAFLPPVDRAHAFQIKIPSSAPVTVVSYPPVDRAHEFQIPIPSFAPNYVASLPSVYPGAWYLSPPLRSPFHSYSFPDMNTGIAVRLPGPSSNFRPVSAIQSSVSTRSESPLNPRGHALGAVGGQKKLPQEASGLCAAFERTSFNTSGPISQELQDTEEMEEGTMLFTAAEGDDDHYGDDDGDEESPPSTDFSLEESSGNAGRSKSLTQPSASALDLSSVQGDLGSVGLSSLEGYATGVQRDCRRGSGNVKLLNSSQLHSTPSPGSLCSAQLDCMPLNVLGYNPPTPSASAQPSATVGEAAPPDTGQSSDFDKYILWRSCKICWERSWILVFIPCGHGSCRYCYRRLADRQLANIICPFCRNCIDETVEVHLRRI